MKALDAWLGFPAVHQEPYARNSLAMAYAEVGQHARASALMQEIAPQYFGTGPVDIQQRDLRTALIAAYILWVNGDEARADFLFDEALGAMEGLHRVRGVDYGIFDVTVHAIREESEAAIAALRDAIDTGWRAGWWQLRGPVFDSMKSESEWNQLVIELEADIARQRQWYEEHKNDPLL